MERAGEALQWIAGKKNCDRFLIHDTEEVFMCRAAGERSKILSFDPALNQRATSSVYLVRVSNFMRRVANQQNSLDVVGSARVARSDRRACSRSGAAPYLRPAIRRRRRAARRRAPPSETSPADRARGSRPPARSRPERHEGCAYWPCPAHWRTVTSQYARASCPLRSVASSSACCRRSSARRSCSRASGCRPSMNLIAV